MCNGIWAGYLAGIATAGLAVAHLIVYTNGYLTDTDATLSQYLTSGLAVSGVAAGFATVAFILARFQGGRKTRLVLIALAWLACALFSLQAVVLAVSGDITLFGPLRPGTYSALAGPAFGVLAWRRRWAG